MFLLPCSDGLSVLPSQRWAPLKSTLEPRLSFSDGLVFQWQLDVRFRNFRFYLNNGFCRRRFFQTQFDLLLIAQQIAPITFFIPILPVHFDRVLDTLAAVTALQIVCTAILVAAPADSFGIFWKNRKFFSHDNLAFFHEIINDSERPSGKLYSFLRRRFM